MTYVFPPKNPPADKLWIANVPMEYATGELSNGWLNELSSTVLVAITTEIPHGSYPYFHAIHREQFGDLDSHHVNQEGNTLGPECKSRKGFMSQKAATRIADFILENQCRNILVHCEAGISRSSAVAIAALRRLRETHYDGGGSRHPNGHVLALMNRAFGTIPIGAETWDGEADFS